MEDNGRTVPMVEHACEDEASTISTTEAAALRIRTIRQELALAVEQLENALVRMEISGRTLAEKISANDVYVPSFRAVHEAHQHSVSRWTREVQTYNGLLKLLVRNE